MVGERVGESKRRVEWVAESPESKDAMKGRGWIYIEALTCTIEGRGVIYSGDFKSRILKGLAGRLCANMHLYVKTSCS